MQTVHTLTQLMQHNNVAQRNSTITVNCNNIQLESACTAYTNVLYFNCSTILANTLAQLLALNISNYMCYVDATLYYNNAQVQALGELYAMEL